MNRFLSIAYTLLLSLLICSQAFGASMYWKSLASDCPVTTNNQDKCLVVDDDSEAVYTHTSGAWVVAVSSDGSSLLGTVGTSDDSAVFQAALNVGGYINIPYRAGGYSFAASSTLSPVSNSIIDFNNAPMYFPSISVSSAITLYIYNVDNVTVRNYRPYSTNDKTRTNPEGGSGLGSNIHGLIIANSTNVKVENYYSKNTEMSLKISLSSNVVVDGFKAEGTAQGIYAAGADNVSGHNWDVSMLTDPSSHDQSYYIDGGCDNWNVSNVTARNNSAGDAITFYDGVSLGAPRNININGVNLFNVKDGITFYHGTNIIVSNIIGVNESTWADTGSWFIHGNGSPDNILVSNFFLQGPYLRFIEGGFIGGKDITYKNGVVASRPSNNMIDGLGVDQLLIENVVFKNATPILTDYNFINGSGLFSDIYKMTLKDSTVYFLDNIISPRQGIIDMENTGAFEIDIINSHFINKAASFPIGGSGSYGLLNAVSGAGGVLRMTGGSYSGFQQLKRVTDNASVISNVWSIDRAAMDDNAIFTGKGSSAPTSTDWVFTAGSRWINTGTDNVIDWKCTVAGAPGTWKYRQSVMEP